MIDSAALMLSAQRALLFCVSSSLRFMSIEVKEASLCMRVHLSEAPNDDEKDNYLFVFAQISGDFPELDDSLSSVEFIISSQPFDKLETLQELVFARQEFENEF